MSVELSAIETGNSHEALEDILQSIFHESLISLSAHSFEDDDCRQWIHIWKRNGLSAGWGPVEIVLRLAWQYCPYDSRLQQVVHNAIPDLLEQREFYILSLLCKIVSIDASPTILSYVRTHGIEDAHGKPDHDLCQIVHEHGTAHEIDTVLQKDALQPDCFEDNNGNVIDAVEDTAAFQLLYESQNNLPNKRNRLLSRIAPTAAMQLQARNYDAVIGIIQSGASLPNHMHAINNENVGYIEWHRHWKRNPMWKVNDLRLKLQKGMRYLLCENDVSQGTTLKKIAGKLDPLSPASIDVCFTGVFFEHSKQKADALDRFDSVFHVNDLNQSTVYSDMLRYKQMLTERLRETT